MTQHIHAPNPVLAALKWTAQALHRHAYGRMTLIVLACLLPFSLARLGLYLAYHEDFRGLGLIEVLSAFLVGLRFDFSIAIVGIFVPLLFMLLPFRWAHHAYWQRLWGWLIYLVLLGLVFMLIADAVYFGAVHRHVGFEIGTLSADMGSMVALAFSQYGLLLLLFGVGAALGALLWRRLLHPVQPAPQRWWPRLLGVLGLLLLFVVVGRGGWTGKPISVGDAFFSNSVAQGYLALNGAFAVTHALNDSAPPPREFMPQDEANRRTQRILAGSSAPFHDPAYPIYQAQRFAGHGNKPNVVVLMLESWGALHVDAMRQQMNLPPLGVTPNFDALARQGRLYTHFYGNGQRSIQGAEAILAGLPTLPGMPFLGEGIEQNRQSFLGEMAQAQGYSTFFLQSSDRGSFRFNSIAARAGFSTYKGAEDIPELHAHPKPPSTWGTWDHNTFQEANKLFAGARKPFLGYIFTSTTHVPWIIPEQRWKKYPEDSDRNKFLNSLYYADWALGELIA
ncbi:MAG TPA: sulfatase-like hydrolase/transferase, partial [Gallionellaceae bacterium]|nr:sulfatase-like hydrolase/transferase [Gallionellaceae bacterium]